VICLATRAREESVRPRLQSGACTRPLNFCVRPMNRTLHRSKRPLVAIGTMTLILVALFLLPALAAGQRPEPDFLKGVLLLVGLLMVGAALPYTTWVTVTDRGLQIQSWLIFRQFVPFDVIDHSDVQYLAEADWPVFVTIYGHGHKSALAQVGLKGVTKEDAAWFSALPQLKAIVHPGLTKSKWV